MRRDETTGRAPAAAACWGLAALLLVQCSGAGGRAETAERARPEPVERRPAPAPLLREVRTTPEVSREALGRLLGQGPGHFFRYVEVEGVGGEDGSGFAGWRLVSLPSTTPPWLDLRVGDVVTSVNGLPLERPDDALRVHELLRVASEVRIELTREGEPRVVRVPVVDAAEPGSEPSAPSPDDDATR